MEQPFNKALQELLKGIEKAREDLQRSINGAMLKIQEGMQEYLNNTIDFEELLKVITKMGIPNIMGMVNTPMEGLDYYKVLGLEKTASDAEVKERYRSIMNKLHPDKIGDEMTFLASLVNIAYSSIAKERGCNFGINR